MMIRATRWVKFTVAGCSSELEDLGDWAWLTKTCDDFDDVPEAVRKAG